MVKSSEFDDDKYQTLASSERRRQQKLSIGLPVITPAPKAITFDIPRDNLSSFCKMKAINTFLSVFSMATIGVAVPLDAAENGLEERQASGCYPFQDPGCCINYAVCQCANGKRLSCCFRQWEGA
ncbi:uncharacterized protein GGS25DRAFT_470228 [Hypoxylon fragiforme]|uniref:uncharacterized protein n=1 Tax=Hypoxylon fragiforme TaxID=63214 RepID=UPI0020C646CF|nr:uncharacterized protein GGS25DRAFT_470228 [Hypoxylon fragiforme]KAI2614069.1 hypothetical protein GGS25DRAFT_470228 [Hypoxylon fragiforme]